MSAPGLLVRTECVGFAESWDVQRALVADRAARRIPDVVWVLEHPPVYTLGRHGDRADLFLSDEALAAMGATVHAIDRGGQMTWHGPGQTTVYVIADLRRLGGVRRFVDALIGAMADAAGIPGAAPGTGATGLYVGGRKLGSVGIRVQGGISSHGIALNRDPDMDWFRWMTACGAPDVPATSIREEGGDPDRARVDTALAAALATRLDLHLEPAGPAALRPSGRDAA